MRNLVFIVTLSVVAGLQVIKPDPVAPDPKSPRVIAAHETLFTEDMTWMEIRDALRDGMDTILIATGGVEQNGPYLVTGKHNVVLRATTQAIARKLGKTLIAPIIPFVPEGDHEPPSLHMRYPGTISLSEDTYERLLLDICNSFRISGFKRLILIGDSGGNQDGMRKVAEQLNSKWRGAPQVEFIPEYYDYAKVTKFVESLGIRQEDEGLHDDFVITSIMLTVDPNSVRMHERVAAKKFRINGVDLEPMEKSVELGRKIIDYRAQQTVEAIRKKG